MSHIYYHVADASYRDGDDLLCWDALLAAGRAPDWKWGTSPYAAADTDVVCLFREDFEAISWFEEFGGRILEIDLSLAPGLTTVTVEEDYPAVVDRIPAACIHPAYLTD